MAIYENDVYKKVTDNQKQMSIEVALIFLQIVYKALVFIESRELDIEQTDLIYIFEVKQDFSRHISLNNSYYGLPT